MKPARCDIDRHSRGWAVNAGQASRLPCRAEWRGLRANQASLRSAGQARRLPCLGDPGQMRHDETI